MNFYPLFIWEISAWLPRWKRQDSRLCLNSLPFNICQNHPVTVKQSQAWTKPLFSHISFTISTPSSWCLFLFQRCSQGIYWPFLSWGSDQAGALMGKISNPVKILLTKPRSRYLSKPDLILLWPLQNFYKLKEMMGRWNLTTRPGKLTALIWRGGE